MSDVFLIVALLGTFFAIVLVGIAVDFSASEKGRAVRMLEAQVSGGRSADLRETELRQSFWRRAAVPVVAKAGSLARRVTPLDARDRIAQKLVLAGSPEGWDAERIMAFKVIAAAGGIVGGFALALAAGIGGVLLVPMIALFGVVGFLLPDSLLARQVAARQLQILKSLSDTLDLLTISVEAGLSLNAAMTHVVANTEGVLSEEFARVLQEVQLGVSRAESFRHLAERTDVEELNAFALAMIQADAFGVSIASVLRTQAAQLRIKRRQRAERQAQQTPVKIVFPLILCILPALFVVIIGPGAIRIAQAIFHKTP